MSISKLKTKAVTLNQAQQQNIKGGKNEASTSNHNIIIEDINTM